jgi:hypothetical protein
MAAGDATDDPRGAPAASPGRVRQRFEQWSANPKCEANVLSAVGNVRMDRVAKRLHVPPSAGQSPFAISAGNTFEATILRDGAQRLRQALQAAGVLATEAARFVDFRTRDKGGPQKDPDAAEAATMAWIRELVAGRARAEDLLVAGATITVPDAAMLPRTRLGLDVVLAQRPAGGAAAAPWRLVVGEVKSYVDRGGYTDRAKLAGARAQAGVYVAGLRGALASLGVRPDQVTVETTGFLVVVRPGGRYPVVFAGEDFGAQAQRAEDGFARMRAIARTQPKLGDEGIDAVAAAARSFVPACVSFCDLAPRCQVDAYAKGEPRVLGEDMAKFVGAVDLHRAYAILEGAQPVTAPEADLARRIAALEALRQR